MVKRTVIRKGTWVGSTEDLFILCFLLLFDKSDDNKIPPLEELSGDTKRVT